MISIQDLPVMMMKLCRAREMIIMRFECQILEINRAQQLVSWQRASIKSDNLITKSHVKYGSCGTKKVFFCGVRSTGHSIT